MHPPLNLFSLDKFQTPTSYSTALALTLASKPHSVFFSYHLQYKPNA